MKKNMFSYLITVVLMMCLSCSEGEGSAKEIRFRDIDWGSPYDYSIIEKIPRGSTFVNYIPATTVNDYLFKIPYYESTNAFGNKAICLKVDSGDSSNFYRVIPGTFETIYTQQVAGYGIYKYSLLFAVVPDENGMIDFIDGNYETSLFFAEYCIHFDDADAAYLDLTNKISSLYGDVYDYMENTSKDSKDKYSVWHGANSTVLVLHEHIYSSGNKEIAIKYATYKGDEILKNVYETLESVEGQGVLDGIDGL